MQQVDEIELYDDEDTYDSQGFELSDKLLPREIEDAAKIAGYTRGIMLVSGMPRQGKDLFGSVLSYKAKKYFVNKHVVRDERPRSLFGEYTLFDENKLVGDMSKLSSIAKGEIPKEAKSKKEIGKLEVNAKKWQSERGEVMFQDAVAHMTEFWRYFHNRRPHNPMGIALGGIVKIWGHLDCLIIGVTQQMRELDAISCLPYSTHEVRCSWSSTRPNTAECYLYKIRYVSSTGVFEMGSKKPTKIWVDGGKQRPELGIELVQLPNGKKLSQLAYDIVEVVHDSSFTNLYDLVMALGKEPDEVEEQLQKLMDKDIIKCKRYFDLYNSKSAVALKPKVSFKM